MEGLLKLASNPPQWQRIILVSELFYPEETSTAFILTKIAKQLSLDFKLLVLTGPVFNGAKPYESKVKAPIDVGSICRIWAPKLGKNNLLERIIRLQALTIGLAWLTILKSRHTDIVFAVTNPAPLIVALAVIRKVSRFRLVFLVHDVFPENAIATGIARSDQVLYRIVKGVFDWAYGAADAIITIGGDMSEVIEKKISASVDKITVIENWADQPLLERIPRDQSLIQSMGLSDHIVIQYAGNIGRAQGLLEFVNLISGVQSDVVRFVLRGSGALSSALRNATQSRKNFILEGSYSRSAQSQVLSACDIALVILGPGMYGLGVPSKTYNILAAGKPLLFLGPKCSEIYRLVKQHNIGWAFDWGESDKLIKLIDSLSLRDLQMIEEKGENARKLAETEFSETQQLAKFTALFKSLQRPVQ